MAYDVGRVEFLGICIIINFIVCNRNNMTFLTLNLKLHFFLSSSQTLCQISDKLLLGVNRNIISSLFFLNMGGNPYVTSTFLNATRVLACPKSISSASENRNLSFPQPLLPTCLGNRHFHGCSFSLFIHMTKLPQSLSLELLYKTIYVSLSSLLLLIENDFQNSAFKD